MKTNKTKSSKILFISHESKLYGAPRSLFYIIQSLHKKWDCQVATYGGGDLIDLLYNIGIKTTILLPLPVSYNNSMLVKRFNKIRKYFYIIINTFKLIDLCGRENVDVIYVNTVAKLSPVLAGKIAKKTVIVHVREGENSLNSKNLKRKISLTIMLRFADELICISEANRRMLENSTRIRAPINVIPNGINISEFKPSAAYNNLIREKYNIPKEATIIGFVGEFSYRKGIDIFFEAAVELCKHKPYYFLVLGGEKHQIEKYKASISENSWIEDRIKFVGFKKDVRPYFSAMDIFSLTSRDEPFGRVNLEAACMGCAIVATRVGGVPEILTDKENAILIPPNSVSALIKAIECLSENSDFAEFLRINARKTVEENFTLEICNHKIEKILEKRLLRQPV